MATKMSENSKKIFDYVKAAGDKNVTAMDIAEALGLTTQQVNGSVTSAFCKKELMVRVPSEIQLEDGTHKQVNFIKLTDAGKNFDPNQIEE